MIPSCLVRKAAALVAVACVLPALAMAQSTQTTQIIDGSGFSEPLMAATADIPADWRAQGGVSWNHGTNCVGNKVRFEWRARSRDDMQGFEIMPGYTWQLQGTQNRMNPCPVQPFRTTREFLEAVMQQRRAGARALQYRDRPDVVAARNAQTPADQQTRVRIDAGQLLISYHSGGVEFREVLGTTVDFTESQGNVVGGSRMVFAQRAPNGQLDFDLGERIVRSFRYDRRWGEMMIASLGSSEKRYSSGQSAAISQWHAREMSRINAEGAADRAAIRSATSREVAKINSATYANTQTTNDTIQRQNLEGIGEYNSYRGTNGAPVQSSIHGGSRVLGNGNGTYFSTNDPYFNPAGSTELQRVR